MDEVTSRNTLHLFLKNPMQVCDKSSRIRQVPIRKHHRVYIRIHLSIASSVFVCDRVVRPENALCPFAHIVQVPILYAVVPVCPQ
jgi:hypothetical protein